MKIDEFETATLLEISTAHMTAEDAERLETEAEGVIFYPLQYDDGHQVGWLVWAGNEDWHPVHGDVDASRELECRMSEAFKTILRFAHENGVRWVKFDRDSPTYECFEVFEW